MRRKGARYGWTRRRGASILTIPVRTAPARTASQNAAPVRMRPWQGAGRDETADRSAPGPASRVRRLAPPAHNFTTPLRTELESEAFRSVLLNAPCVTVGVTQYSKYASQQKNQLQAGFTFRNLTQDRISATGFSCIHAQINTTFARWCRQIHRLAIRYWAKVRSVSFILALIPKNDPRPQH